MENACISADHRIDFIIFFVASQILEPQYIYQLHIMQQRINFCVGRDNCHIGSRVKLKTHSRQKPYPTHALKIQKYPYPLGIQYMVFSGGMRGGRYTVYFFLRWYAYHSRYTVYKNQGDGDGYFWSLNFEVVSMVCQKHTKYFKILCKYS